MRTRWAWCALAVFLVAGCDRKSEIKVYRVVKAPLEESAIGQQNTMPTNLPSPGFAGGTTMSQAPVVSAAPPGWEPQPPSQMRQASFLVKGDKGAVVDISLVTLGSSASNVLDNVNRWLGQLGQPPVAAEKLGEITQRLTTAIGEVTIVDIAGLPNDTDPARDGRIIAAMAGTDRGTLFFKMRGNAALAEAQKGEFIKWVAAVCNSQSTDKPAETGAMQAESSAAPQIKWETPDGWQEVPASSMRYASFNAQGPNGGKVDISIVTFPGEGGSDADNVNRWRRQIGLEPLDDKQMKTLISPINAGETEFSTLDMTGGDSRVIAAWTRRDGRSWFFKMSGPGRAVEAQKSKFFDFLRSVNFHS